MRVIRMTLQYVGNRYRGWQTQSRGGTVQDVLEASLSRILNERVRVHGAGRTDRGVHARGQVASFETENPLALERLHSGLNALLPDDIAAMECDEAPEGFHARHSARRREYSYQVWRGRVCTPFARPFVYHLHRPLDLDAMGEAARGVIGSHDFTSFCAAQSIEGPMQREVLESSWSEQGELWIYRVAAESFLHHMVRNLVGTMIEVGLRRRGAEEMGAILDARDRRAAGPMAPTQGLFLEKVHY